MSAHLARAEVLLQQSRPADAEREAGLALAQDPENPYAYALLALSRLEQRRAAEALEAARRAVGLGADTAYFHRVHAHVLHLLDRDAEALGVVDEAIRLDPEDEESFALRASIQLARRDWAGALAAAERGLGINPEHVGSANMRAAALVRLGRKEEATAMVDYALSRAPENAHAHANQGWTYLHRNDPLRAQEHFREALRLEPDLEFARQGMLEALKARNPVYRGMLAYFLWMGRQSRRAQWGFVIATFLATGFARGAAESVPGLGWVLWPLVGVFYLFIYLSWTSAPVFNLLLRFDRFGRWVLSAEERRASRWFGATLAASLGLAGWFLLGGPAEALVGAVAGLVLSVCVAATWTRRGRARRVLGLTTALLAAVAVAAVVALHLDLDEAAGLARLFFVGFFGFQVLANTVRE